MKADLLKEKTEPATGVPRERARPSKSYRKAVGRLWVHVLLCAGSVLMIIPFAWMILSSLKDLGQVFTIPPQWIPNPVHFSNYPDAWRALPFARAYFNSTYIAVTVVAIQLITCAMAAYAFARIRFRFRETIFVLFLATMMIPYQMTIIPLYIIMKQIGWLDTHWALIVPPSLFNAFGVFLLRQFIRGLPKDLEEAALIDGANRWTIFVRIIVPLLAPPLSALGVLSFLNQWNSFFNPLIFLNSPDKYTVPLLVAQFRGQYSTSWPLLMAASAIAIVPVLAVYIAGQRRIIEGIALTGVKG